MAIYDVKLKVTHIFHQCTTVHVRDIEAGSEEEAYDIARDDKAVRESKDSYLADDYQETEFDSHEVTLIRADDDADSFIPRLPSHLLTAGPIMIMGAAHG